MSYIPRTKEEKRKYAKRFSEKERDSYRKGIRYGFLQGIHKNKKNNSITDRKAAKKRHYTKAEYDALFDDIENIKI